MPYWIDSYWLPVRSDTGFSPILPTSPQPRRTV
jgi:hypothetical protein